MPFPTAMNLCVHNLGLLNGDPVGLYESKAPPQARPALGLYVAEHEQPTDMCCALKCS